MREKECLKSNCMSCELRLGNSIELETLIEFEMEQQQQRDELFRILFAVVRDDHPENVFTSMENIMYVLLDETEDITQDLLLILLSTLGRRSIQGVTVSVSEAARKLAMNVIESRAAKLEPVVKQFLVSSMSEDGPSNCCIDYHRLIYDLYRYSPQILSTLIPYITRELLNDQSEARIRTVNLVGELFAIPDSVIHEAFQPIFVEFLKRLTDRDVQVRMTVLEFVKKSLRSNPSRPKGAQIFAALCDRLLDYDENMRKQVVAIICDVACFNPGSVPVETTKLVAERLHDKFVSLETLAVKVSANLSHPSESGEFQDVMNGACKQDGSPMCKDLIRKSSISKGGEEEHVDEGNMKEVSTYANKDECTQKNKYVQIKPELDDWVSGTNFNKGLMSSPDTPVPVLHKAERKYEIGKVSDEEQAKQRKFKGILNKLTPQNFDRLFEQVRELNIYDITTLVGVSSQIFDRALTEPIFCEMYANFCQRLASCLPYFDVDDKIISFRRLLLNKCQEEFERGLREEQEANNADGEGGSEAVREEMRAKVRRRMLGNIRLIGELYKNSMLTERIMHACIMKLLGQYQKPDEKNIEALLKLMSIIGKMIDHPKAKEHMDAYFDIMGLLSNNMKLSSRVRFMVKDAIDLRKNKWQQRRKIEGPKKIEEVHRDAAQERQGQVNRLSRNVSMNAGARRGQPLEFGPRGSMLSSPIGTGMGYRGMSPQIHGFGGQDMRMDGRNIYESSTVSVPLPQRSSSDEPIMLGPQGCPARDMAHRQPSVSRSSLYGNSPSFGDSRRMGGGLNGYGAAQEPGIYSTREGHFPRNASDRFGASVAFDQSSSQELNSSSANRDSRYLDRNLDRSRPTTSSVPRAGISVPQNHSSNNVFPEERLRDMSIAAIKEFYSVKDEKEVALCIKDLNAPSFYPNVVSIWVSDSFERKDIECDSLAKLLVSLTKPQDGTFSPSQLIQGFESVLTDLEDTVTDAPKAPEFLGRIFAKVVLENVLLLKDVGHLIQHGGEEPGRLVEVGLAAQVVASLLEMIKSEKGESTLNEIQVSSNLQLHHFLPPSPVRCPKLEMFM